MTILIQYAEWRRMTKVFYCCGDVGTLLCRRTWIDPFSIAMFSPFKATVPF